MIRIALLSCAFALSTSSVLAGNAEPPRFVARPGELEFSGSMIVKPISASEWVQRGVDADLADVRSVTARILLDGLILRENTALGQITTSIPAGEDENSFAERLLATGLFKFAHPNWLCFPDKTPNDENYGNQWHHPMISSPAAWDNTTGDENLVLAILDTGIDVNHADLKEKRVAGYNAPDRKAEVDGGEVADINGHGTATAGTAAASGDNSIGVAGVSYGATKVMAVRVSNFSNGGAYYEDIFAGAQWAADNGAKVISASYSGVDYDAVDDAGAYVNDKGALFCWAAGNGANDWSYFDWPHVIVCGGTDESDGRAYFSSYGKAVDFYAPATNIVTTYNGGGYGGASGTSFSTPMINGALGLIWAAKPSLEYADVERILAVTCDDKGDPGEDEYWGWGRINVGRAVQTAIDWDGQSPFAIDDAAEAVENQSVVIDVLANDFDINSGDPISLIAWSNDDELGGTIELVTVDGRDLLKYTPPANGSGIAIFDYTIEDGAGHPDTATVTITVYAEDSFRQPDVDGDAPAGVDVAYFEIPESSQLPNFAKLSAYKLDTLSQINVASTDGVFATSGRADLVAAAFEGLIEVPATGFYTLYVSSDDGSKLYVGDTLLANNDYLHGMQEVGGRIGLKAGKHAIRVEFFENYGGAGCIVSWSGSGLDKQVIPAASWFRDRRLPGDVNCDGEVTFDDIDGFVTALISRDEYEASFPECPYTNADTNGDGGVDFDDIDSFVTCLINGGC
jgi:subtilisin family serine protease